MALQNLAEQSRRILEAAMRGANSCIHDLTTALRAQQNLSRQLLADMWQFHNEANRMSIELAAQDELIAQLRERINTLEAGLVSQRLQTEIFREELQSERLLSTHIRDVLLPPQQNNLDTIVPHHEPASPEAMSETAEPAAPQTHQGTIPTTLQSVPMSREPPYRRHGEPKAE